MYTITPVTGHPGGECYLVDSGKTALLVDAGFDFCAEKTVENIRFLLGDRPLEYILASHSHYDHISGIPKIKRAYPMLKAVGSRKAQAVADKKKARELMQFLNASFAQDLGIALPPDRIDELSIDMAMDDGQEIRLGDDMTIQAMETPGHTRCAINYHFLEERLLVCSETLGIAPRYPEVIPCLIVGYRSTLDAIERSRELRPRHVFVSHMGLIPDGEADRFFDNARLGVEKAVSMLLEMHGRGCSENEITAAFRQEFYIPCAALQPERAFILNTRALIPRILEELGKTPVPGR